MTNAALECTVVRPELVDEALVAFAVQHACSWCIFARHPRVLGQASPVQQVLARLQGWLHGNTWEQVIVFGHKRALHFGLFDQSWPVEVKGAVTHHCLPLLGLELIIALNLEHDWVLAPGRSRGRVLAGVGLPWVGIHWLRLFFDLTLSESIGELPVKDLVFGLLAKLGFQLCTVLHF